jgi:hypothetical protein
VLKFLVAGLAAAALWPTAIRAQSGNSTFSGIVKDATGAPIPAAQVRVVNEDTSVAVETLTNDVGLYRVGALVPGEYRIEVNFPYERRARASPHRRPYACAISSARPPRTVQLGARLSF